MKSNKLSLLFDGNHFLYKTLYVLPKFGKSKKLLETEEQMKIFMRKLAIDFAAEIRRFYQIIDRVIFVIDSTSWRKDYYPTLNYKGNRVQNDDVDWNNFYKVILDFKAILAGRGVTVCQIPGTEGDDLVFAWSRYLNLKGENVIIVSGDQDLMQLIGYNKSTDSYTTFYTNTNKKLVINAEFLTWLKSNENDDVNSIFEVKKLIFGNTVVKNTFKELIKTNDLNVIVLDPKEFVLKKVLTGDRGDNVMPIYYYEKNTRTFGLTHKMADKIYADILSRFPEYTTLYLFDKSFREEIKNSVIRIIGADKMPPEQILENIQNNVMLLVLHSKSIPDEIIKAMFNDIENLYPNSKMNIDLITSKDVILEGTSYLDLDYVPDQYKIFDI